MVQTNTKAGPYGIMELYNNVFVAALLRITCDMMKESVSFLHMDTLPPYTQMRNLPRVPGIYIIVNKVNHNRYIGSTINLYRRCGDHWRMLLKGKHKNRHLQSACDKYGSDSFAFKVLELVDVKEHLLVREQHYIDTLSPEYNLSPIAGNTLGTKYSDESRAKLVAARKGWKPTPESIEKGRITRTGKKMPPEFGAAISARQKGITPSPDTRAKMSKVRKGKPRPLEEAKKSAQSRTGLKRSSDAIAKTAAWHSGNKRSDEARANMSLAQKNKGPVSEETRAKLSAAGRGRVISEQARRKSSETQKGRVISEETRQKMSIAAKNRRKREREQDKTSIQ